MDSGNAWNPRLFFFCKNPLNKTFRHFWQKYLITLRYFSYLTLDFKIHFFRQYIFTAFENYFLQCSHIHTTYMCIFMFIFIHFQIIFQMLQCNHHEPMLVVSSIMTTTKITSQRQRKFLLLQKHLPKLQVWNARMEKSVISWYQLILKNSTRALGK